MSGLLLLFLVTRTRWFERLVKRSIRVAARRWAGLEVRDYVELLDVSEDYAIHDVTVGEGDWLADTELRHLDLPSEGVLVLGIRSPDGAFVGAPRPDTRIHAGDVVLLYGREEALEELRGREKGAGGDVEHSEGQRRHERAQADEHARRRDGGTVAGTGRQTGIERDAS